jgi:hypothetical protein
MTTGFPIGPADIFREMPVKIVRDAKFLEHQGTRSRYPLFRDPSRSISNSVERVYQRRCGRGL